MSDKHRMWCKTCQAITDHRFEKVEKRFYMYNGQQHVYAKIVDMKCTNCKTLWTPQQ